jgi:endonuclease YncB( thermonuclease family)
MRRCSTWIALIVLGCGAVLPTTRIVADEEDFEGVVTRVFDGDSFLVRPTAAKPGPREINVRLMDIDAPEKDQPYANTSRSALIRLIEGRRVFVDVIEVDQYQRKIAKVYREPDRLDITHTLVHDGHVWVNRKYTDDDQLIALENIAKAKRTGLWSLKPEQLVPPWQFRRERREEPQKNTKKRF